MSRLDDIDYSAVEPDLQRVLKLLKIMLSVNEVRRSWQNLERFITPDELERLPRDDQWPALLDMNAIFSAAVVAYGRIFASATGTSRLNPESIYPARLRPKHDWLLRMRHERVAHHGEHPSMDMEVGLQGRGDELFLVPSIGFRTYFSDDPEITELFTLLDAYMHRLVTDACAKMSEKLGVKVSFPSGPPPPWGERGLTPRETDKEASSQE